MSENLVNRGKEKSVYKCMV